ncbi:uncharacterized protein LOC127281521 [Leptopilina boulardi]|uniref:uncharacterized protein LOC127281521 n=1 Tax=Leptopilina boulardi TaxID=63433 RepID=UPI0021F66BCF|nr:uncharacterized protein LOC127281521 [Leptopilina boulardi]
MKLIFFSSCIICILHVQFCQSFIEINKYSIKDFAIDMMRIKQDLFKYKEKVHLEFEIYYNQTVENFFCNHANQSKDCMSKQNIKNGYDISLNSEENKNIDEAVQKIKACINNANNSLLRIPLEDIDYVISNFGADVASNLKIFSRDCEYWTAVLSRNITMNECYALKSPIFQLIVNNFRETIDNLKILIVNNAKKMIESVKNCASLAEMWFKKNLKDK